MTIDRRLYRRLWGWVLAALRGPLTLQLLMHARRLAKRSARKMHVGQIWRRSLLADPLTSPWK